MRNRFDHVAKEIGREALGFFGATVAHDEISPETQHADLRHEPDPKRAAERGRLGLLGRIAATLCLIEIYSRAPGAAEFRACLTKHLAFWQQRARKARARNEARRTKHRSSAAFEAPSLWIITAGTPTTLLTELELEPAIGWPPGVYRFGADILRVGIIVASELPCDRSTLLVRLMAGKPLLPRAIEDLAALPAGAYERTVAEPILVNFQRALGKKSRRAPEEQEFMMTMYRSWDDARAQGRAEGSAEAVLTVLRGRGLAIPHAVRKRIQAEKDPQRLEQWLEKAVVATSVEEVIGERPAVRSSKANRSASHKERDRRRPPRPAAAR
jgi:hypothetical protein